MINTKNHLAVYSYFAADVYSYVEVTSYCEAVLSLIDQFFIKKSASQTELHRFDGNIIFAEQFSSRHVPDKYCIEETPKKKD